MPGSSPRPEAKPGRLRHDRDGGNMSSSVRGGRLWIVAALGTSQTLAWASSYYLAAMVADPMARTFGIATTTVFAAFSLALLLAALLGPRIGRQIDRLGGREVLALS